MIITNDILISHFECSYKSFKKSRNFKGEKTDLEKFNLSENKKLKNAFVQFHKIDLFQNNSKVELSKELLSLGCKYISDIKISNRDVEFHLDFIEKILLKDKKQAYVPILVVHQEKCVPTGYKILLSGIGKLLSDIQGVEIPFGRILYGKYSKSLKVNFSSYFDKYHVSINEIRLNQKPDFYLNYHCSSCEFQKTCRKEALELDSLSLLKGIPKKRIEKLNKKGIFTVDQLSYTFRPKRKLKKRNTSLSITKSFELQALSIREKKIHVINTPELPKSNTKIYFDIEGIPETNFNYLIGLKVTVGNEVSEFSLWSDSLEGEKEMLRSFIALIYVYENPILFHYGAYESKYLNLAKKGFQNLRKTLIRSSNIVLTF